MKFRQDEVSYVPQEQGIDGMYKMMEKAARICYKTEDRIGEGTAEKIIENTIIPSGHTSVLEFGTVYLKFNILLIWKWLKYVLDRYSRVRVRLSGAYVTTTYRTIMQGGYKDPVEAIKNKFDKDWKKDLEHWCEPTEKHHKRYCFHFVMDRVGSQSVMRHRGVWGISYAQESTRFVNYANENFGKEITFSIPSKLYEIISELLSSGECPKSAARWTDEQWIEYLEKNNKEWIEYETALKQSEESYMKLIGLMWKPQDARGVLNLDVKTEFMMLAYKEDWKMWLFRRLDTHAHKHIQWFAKQVKDFFGDDINI